MFSLNLLTLLTLSAIGINAQYNTPPPYDRDRQDQPYDRPYDRDRQNPPYGSQYDRQNPPYGQYDRQNPPYGQQYDRHNQPYNQNNQYNQSQPYGRQNQNQYGNQSQYGNQGPPYGGNRDPYDRDQYGSTRNPYDSNRDQQFGGNRDRDQYYVGNRDQQYPGGRDQPYGGTREPPYGGNRDQYPYGENRNQPPYGGNRDQPPYGGNRDQPPYGGNRNQPYDRNRDQYHTGNRNEQYGGGSNFGGPQYGSPLSDDNCCPEYCLTSDEQPYLNFATKTAYELVFGRASNQHRVPECTPVQFWSINRHGTRYPGVRTISRLRELRNLHSEIIKNYDDRRSFPNNGRLCVKDLEIFRKWRWNDTINEGNANSLTRQGMDDLKYLARRFSTRFPELLGTYSEEAFNFQYTDTDRTHDSYQAYIEGLFKSEAYRVHANLYNDDRLIKPTKSCNTWLTEVDENPRTLEEYMKFRRGPEFQQMIRDVFRRLGFRHTLGENVIDDMYDMCRFDKAWDLTNPSPWCIVFNKEQLKLLEYAEDLKYYYKGGYGNEINRRIGCPPLKDLYEKFERTVNGNGNGNKATIFFTHSITIQTFLTAMGIARDDEPLRADNYFRQARRKWRTSTIDPFASNLAAILYECRSGERHRVMFFLNEVPVNFPDCSVGLCNWNTVKNKLESASLNCNLDFCDQNAATALQRGYIIYLISFVAILFSFKVSY